MRALLSGLLVALLLAMTAPALAAGRVALVIGNSDYEKVGALPNPGRDAADLAAALERIDFTVTLAKDLDGAGMRGALRSFRTAAVGADIAIVYFAGHGIEIDKQNFIIPVDASLDSDSDVLFEAIPMALLEEAVSGATGLRMVLLDACRNNPFVSQMQVSSANRSIGRGLSPVEPVGATLVAYSARAGTVALDGPSGQNSPFMKALLQHIEEPGLDIMLMLRRVRDSVMETTNNRQEPFTYGSLPGREVFLVPDAKAPETQVADVPVTPTPPPAPPAPTLPVDPGEEFAWGLVQERGDVAAVQEFLRVYPRGAHAADAVERLIALTQGAPATPPVAEAAAEPAPAPEPVPEAEVPTRIAEVPAVPAVPVVPEAPDQSELIRSIQQELRRAGCNPGPADGIWGRRSRAAVTAFAQDGDVSIASLEPSEQLLRTLRTKSGVVCVQPEPEPEAEAPVREAEVSDDPLDNLSGECRGIYRQYQGRTGPKAFALSSNGDDCGWAAEYPSVRDARERALAECAARGNGCRVVDTADASLSISSDVDELTGQCRADYQAYRGLGNHRAFAVSSNGEACGWGFGYDSVGDAQQRAVLECRNAGGRGCEVINSR